MSLINQMLRDLQQRRDGRPGSLSPTPARKPRRRPRRRVSFADLFRAAPPLLWVGIGGLAGLLLLWGAFGWLSGVFGPNAPVVVPQPPPELVAIASAPSPAATDVSVPAKRRAPPVPTAAPPPPPPLAYGAPAPPLMIPVQPAVTPPAPPLQIAPTLAVPATPAYPVDRPVVLSVPPRSNAAPAPAGPQVPAAVASPPARPHPDLLPGAVNTANLALQKAVLAAAAAPPLVTPYGRAEEAYRQGRAAYDANLTDTSLEALGRALQLYPGHLPARELLVDQLEMNGRIEEAYNQLRQGLTIAPDYAPFRKRAARMLLDRNDAAGAVRALTGNGLPRVETDPELHQLLAGIYLQLGENFLAAQTYRNLVVHAPQGGAYWLGLGDALAADGQPLEARRAYRRAIAAGGLSREEVARASKSLAQL